MHRVTVRRAVWGPLVVAAVFAAVACIYWPTFSYLLGFGRDTDNSSPGALVLVIFLVLIWRLRTELAPLPIRPFLFGLIGLTGLGFVWLAGQLVYTRVLTQFAVLALIPMVVLTLLGIRWLAAMAFPMLVLLFAVPVWSPLVPILVKWTARFAEWGIHASGVPVFREGAYFVIPSGTWSIADTCSGVAFLSTCLMLGVLYAWTIYRSPLKRIVFIAGAIVIGVVGNWIRVYLTIMIAHLSDNRLLRDNHYMFGWLLFAVFLFLLCWLGWGYSDAEQHDSAAGKTGRAGAITDTSSPGNSSASRLFAVSVAVLFTMAIWPALESRLAVQGETGRLEIADISPQRGWSRVGMTSVEWVPEISNPSQVRVQVFEKDGQRVDVYFGMYQNETWESKLVTSSNQLAGAGKSNWTLADRGIAAIEISGRRFDAKTGVILGRTGRILAWHWYWIHGLATGNDLRAKLQQLLDRLQGTQAVSAWVAIYTDANASADASTETLRQFMTDMAGSLDSALVRTAK